MTNPSVERVEQLDASSVVAVAGHPVHAMAVTFPIALVISTLGTDVFYWYSADPFWVRAGLWSSGFAFGLGVFAGVIGTIELLAVEGIRKRAASWNHAVAAVMLLSIAGMNWAIRLNFGGEIVLPLGLSVSLLATVFVGLAGWHGGKLVFDHGVGMRLSSKE